VARSSLPQEKGCAIPPNPSRRHAYRSTSGFQSSRLSGDTSIPFSATPRHWRFSPASTAYVEPLLQVFGDRLLFPPTFVGRGDMSRGGLLLRAVAAGRELDYAPLAGALRHGPRPPRLQRR
jgi:hypothetical protein